MTISSNFFKSTSARRVQTDRIETDTHVIHLRPRISAAKLAEYVVTDPARQEVIARDSKVARVLLKAPYNRVRTAVRDAFVATGFLPDVLLRRASEVEAAPARTLWYERDNRSSAEALRNLASIVPGIRCSNATLIHRPAVGWGHVMLEGVRVSINPEIVFSTQHKGITKLGGVILNTGQAEKLSLARSSANHSMGDYLSSLVFRMIEERLKLMGAPLYTKCHAVDIFRNQIYTAPQSHVTLNKRMAAACRMIALRWETIPTEVPTEEEGEPPF